jgi:putative transposase
MKTHRAYRVELDPNNVQRSAFRRAAGCARWAYNWGLGRKIEAIAARKAAIAAGVAKADLPKVPNAMDLHKELVILKNLPSDQGGVPWMYESSKSAPQEALRNLDKAFEAFYRKCKAKTPGSKGFPRFKSKKRNPLAFRLGKAKVTNSHVTLPRIGSVKLKEQGYLPTDVKILGSSVKERAGRWFVSLTVEQDLDIPTATGKPVIGVDVGISTLATLSDGTRFENPKALGRGLKRLKLLQRSLSRKVKGSSNRAKAQKKVASQHYRISCVRQDAIHKASDVITKRASTIVVEDLNVAGMLKNRSLARSVADSSMAELHRQVIYKAGWRGVAVKTASRWFPSSKTCSQCKVINQGLTLSDRQFHCHACGMKMDRDLNAAINLANLSDDSIAGSSPVGSVAAHACGEASSGVDRKVDAKLASVKQEPNPKEADGLFGSV